MSVPITTAGGGTAQIASEQIAGVDYTVTKRYAGAGGVATPFLDVAAQTTTFTSNVNSSAVDVSRQGMSTFSLQCASNGVGSVTAWEVVLEGSLDGTHYDTILKHRLISDGTETVAGDGRIASSGTKTPMQYFRSRCVSVTASGGGGVVSTVVGMP